MGAHIHLCLHTPSQANLSRNILTTRLDRSKFLFYLEFSTRAVAWQASTLFYRTSLREARKSRPGVLHNNLGT